MARKGSGNLAGAGVLFIGSLVYLYVVYSWYGAGAAFGSWLTAASFLAPFVAAMAVVSSVSLFFMSLGKLAGMQGGDEKTMSNIIWKFVIYGAMTLLIVTSQSALFIWALVGFVLTYIGAAMLGM
jgi:uncharacterized membrane protein